MSDEPTKPAPEIQELPRVLSLKDATMYYRAHFDHYVPAAGEQVTSA